MHARSIASAALGSSSSGIAWSTRSAWSRRPCEMSYAALLSASTGCAQRCRSLNASSQTPRLAPRPSAIERGASAHSRRPARSESWPATACCSASCDSPCASCQSTARRCSSGSRSGSIRVSSARSVVASSGWCRNAVSHRSSGSSGTPRSRSVASMAVDPRVSSTASHSGPVSRGSTDAAAQERALSLGQLVEQLGPEVVGDEAVGAGEVGDRAVGVRLFGDRQPGEIQRRGPARGPLDQAVELSAVELQPGRREQPRGLQPGHRELARRDLVDEVVRAQPPDRRGRSDARREREHGALGQSLGGLDELAQRRLVGELRVVDDDHARRGLVDQLRRLADAVLGGVRLQRDPGERPAVAGRPLGEERRLAVARGRHDQDDRRVAAGDQAPDESRTRHHPAPERRRAELRAAAIRQVQREDGCFSGHA